MQSRQLSAPAGDPDDLGTPSWPADAPEAPVEGRGQIAVRRLARSVRDRATLLNAVLAVLVVAGGVWAYTTVRGGSGAATAATASASTGRRVTVGLETVTATASTSGTVASSDVVSANFTTSGTVTHIYVKLGQTVTKGQELARIDATAADQQLKTAKDNLTAAQDSLTRAKGDSDTTAIDSAQLQVDSASDAVTSARAAVAGVVLTAPIAGTVIAQNGTVGASSGASSSGSGSGGGNGAASTSSSTSSGFIQIADMTKMEVDTDFPEADATKLAVGMPATVTWNALTGATATAQVASIDPTATTTNNVVSYGVVVELTSLPKGIRIGQSTTVVVTIASKAGVLAVPGTAVTGAGTAGVVTLYVNGATSRTPVGLGLVGDSFTEITSGLQAGDVVVLPAATTTGGTTTTNPFGGGGGLGGLGGGGGFGGAGGGGFTRGGGTGATGTGQ